MTDWAMYGNINPFPAYSHFKKSSKPFLGNMNFPDVPLYALPALYLRAYSVVARLYLLLSLDMTLSICLGKEDIAEHTTKLTKRFCFLGRSFPKQA